MSETWNHRVIVHPDGPDDTYLAVHEVYYRKGKPIMWTENPVGVGGISKREVYETLARMRRAYAKPYLMISGKKLVEYDKEKFRAARRSEKKKPKTKSPQRKSHV